MASDTMKRSDSGGNCKKVGKIFAKAAFSHVGFTIIVILYSVAGAYLFKLLEQTNELETCIKSRAKYEQNLNETRRKIWEVSQRLGNPDAEEDAKTEFRTLLRTHRDNVMTLNYDGVVCEKMGKENGTDYQWNLAGSLLFSVTVITTVGYGNIAPKTNWGRLVLITYAMMGIPIMLVWLSNLGGSLADVFRFVYLKICCCGCCSKKRNNYDKNANKSSGNAEDEKAKVIVDDDEDEEDDEEEEYGELHVPVTITLSIIGVYLLFGALCYNQWEGWPMVTALYFCFVTTATIGFGDLVPGATTLESKEDQLKMLFTAVYMLFGMAILSMCFALIQEEISTKFRWLGQKLGIIDKPEDERFEEEEEDEREATKTPIETFDDPNKNGQSPMLSRQSTNLDCSAEEETLSRSGSSSLRKRSAKKE